MSEGEYSFLTLKETKGVYILDRPGRGEVDAAISSPCHS